MFIVAAGAQKDKAGSGVCVRVCVGVYAGYGAREVCLATVASASLWHVAYVASAVTAALRMRLVSVRLILYNLAAMRCCQQRNCPPLSLILFRIN